MTDLSTHPADVGVLVVHHGAVDRAEDIAAFVTNVRHGRPAPSPVVDEVTHRWKHIGGSPLNAIVRAQADAVAARTKLPVEVAARLWTPRPADVIPSLAARGCRRVVSLPLAPFSVRVYHAVVAEACAEAGIACIEAPPWGTNRHLVEGFAGVIDEALRSIADPPTRDRTHLLLTAHSLPMRVIAAGDSYDREVRATFDAVVNRLEFPRDRALLAYQSQGMPDPRPDGSIPPAGNDWLGPDLPTTLAMLRDRGATHVVCCAIGFLADHTEVLYDLDVEARSIAQRLGLGFTRAASLNVRRELVDALVDVTESALSRI